MSWVRYLWDIYLNLVWRPRAHIRISLAMGEHELECVAFSLVITCPEVDCEIAVLAIVNILQFNIVRLALFALHDVAKEAVLCPTHAVIDNLSVLWHRPGLKFASSEREIRFWYRQCRHRVRHIDPSFRGSNTNAADLVTNDITIVVAVQCRADQPLATSRGRSNPRFKHVDGAWGSRFRGLHACCAILESKEWVWHSKISIRLK
mmetsp:Transcript_14753/g.37520  ORF Transcript_14753/g.37520 Transcript_14753/m.37520 type:complete len:205 (-) Transcript_14753:1132-1746(-)